MSQLLAAEVSVTGSVTTCVTTLPTYDSTKWSIGSLFKKRTDVGAIPFIAPIVPTVIRPVETSAAIPAYMPRAVQWSSGSYGQNIDWLFLATQATAANTRTVQLFRVNRDTSDRDFVGYVILNYPQIATAVTIKSMRISYELHKSGTCAASGSGFAGTDMLLQTNRIPSGCRIGFGSQDPKSVTEWKDIVSITGENAGTVSGSIAGTYASGTSYVIEDLRILTLCTNATVANGGLFMAKGLSYNIFSPVGFIIQGGGFVDNQRYNYWLADAQPVTNTLGCGMGMKPMDTWQQQFVYVLDSAGSTTCTVYKYNFRAALSLLSAGKDTTQAIQFRTALQSGLTGNVATLDNGRFATAGHGPGSGIPSFYFVSASRIYRCAETNLYSGSTSLISDFGTEVPPGGVLSYAATAAFSTIEYSDRLDRFIVFTTGATAFRHYITKYYIAGERFDHILCIDDKQLDQATADPDLSVHGTTNSLVQSIWAEGGLLYMATHGTTATTNLVRVLPTGADWLYTDTTNQHCITPELSTPGCVSFSNVYVKHAKMLGGATIQAIGIPAEPFKVYYRLSGISDNSGTWVGVSDDGDLTGLAAESIQFDLRPRTIGPIGGPTRFYTVGVTYTAAPASSTHWAFCADLSDKTNKYFAFYFATAYGGDVPTLKIVIKDIDTQIVQLTDYSSGSGYPTGTWQISTNSGGTWGSMSVADRANSTTFLRYTPASMPDSIKAMPILTEA